MIVHGVLLRRPTYKYVECFIGKLVAGLLHNHAVLPSLSLLLSLLCGCSVRKMHQKSLPHNVYTFRNITPGKFILCYEFYIRERCSRPINQCSIAASPSLSDACLTSDGIFVSPCAAVRTSHGPQNQRIRRAPQLLPRPLLLSSGPLLPSSAALLLLSL